ncbi:sigma-70 family RNA polymerase sigma factor [Blastopirellula sp. JC732]|uniref:Sigma-70 family RNA polymerase sigma factor n=1 Tax=Blastopirellula sediminis TaxID=2894196 RepID=A0A9X1MHH2_9BACT|nr:sigma-70 family RNA polymerase sigma factor [Blastopirellula sediminis]MCC9608009.1 sigma-70 family RNA polymerase sigma factor [Blastopirellula sediminis]MCC9627198.1 sigma-70 family RNA polymerase sigma factor [Blastopirellula sediminis]
MENQGSEFSELLERLKNGDEAAAAELARKFENEVRRFIRFRLTSPSVRRMVDSLDIYQSVLIKFFTGFDQGDFRLEDPEELRRLLLTMARNKIVDHARRHHAGRRDARRISGDEAALNLVADSNETPSRIVETDEILHALEDRLSEDDRVLLHKKLSGYGWTDLAEEMGTNPDALRKRLTRAIDRAASQLGLISDK